MRSSASHLFVHIGHSEWIPAIKSRVVLQSHLLTVVCSCNWGSFFLKSDWQAASDKIYYKLHKCLDPSTLSKTQNIHPKRDHCDCLNCRPTKRQWDFFKTRYFPLFLHIICLAQTTKTVLDSINENREPLAQGQHSPNAALAKLLKRKITHSWSSDTQIPFVLHNNIYINNLQEIAFALVNGNSPATSCWPAWLHSHAQQSNFFRMQQAIFY